MIHSKVEEVAGKLTIPQAIVKCLEINNGSASVGGICESLQVGFYDIRDSITLLENQGVVRGTPGGGTNPSPLDTTLLLLRKEDKTCPLAPYPGRCIVVREQYKTKATIIITDQTKRIPTIGKVVAVGDEARHDLLGKRVLFGRYSGVPVHISGHPQYDIFDYSELLAEVTTTEKIEFDLSTDAPLGE